MNAKFVKPPLDSVGVSGCFLKEGAGGVVEHGDWGHSKIKVQFILQIINILTQCREHLRSPK